MTEAWPETVQAAILWVHEADLAAIEAKRAHELKEAEAGVISQLPSSETPRAVMLRALAPTQNALDRLELEAEKRHRWLVYIVGRAARREERGERADGSGDLLGPGELTPGRCVVCGEQGWVDETSRCCACVNEDNKTGEYRGV